jgi:hypothetical protein
VLVCDFVYDGRMWPTINRAVAIISPKQAFVDWANGLPDDERVYTLDDFADDNTTLLIPDSESTQHATFIDKHWQEIFENELFAWCTNEDWWPEKITKEMFGEWFDVTLHSMVLDMLKDPLDRDKA